MTAYTSGVTFGAAVKRLRGETVGIDVAANALGPGLPEKRYRDFANYLSRIENGRVPNLGLKQLRLIAKGLGFHTLSSFFAQIEALPRSEDVSKVTPSTNIGSGAHADSVSAAVDVAVIEAILVRGFGLLGEHIDRAVDRLAQANQQAPGNRVKRTKGRAAPHKRDRKIA